MLGYPVWRHMLEQKVFLILRELEDIFSMKMALNAKSKFEDVLRCAFCVNFKVFSSITCPFRLWRSGRQTLRYPGQLSSSFSSVTKINHKYYVSEIIPDGQRYWREIQGDPRTKVQTGLSDHFLRAQELKLNFKFPYYGHYLESVVLTTGGFLYMDVHDTRLITDVKYLAPLMAYFSSKQDANSTVNSTVLTLDDGMQLTVQWLNVSLHNKTDAGQFNFQCTLHKNGTIWFAYKQIPVPVESIPDEPYHPVRVGISDAFVIHMRDSRHPEVMYRIFYIYSQVNITKNSIISGSAVVFHPLPSCVIANSCSQCMTLTETTEFNCQWCQRTRRCSDGADRHRAQWEVSECRLVAVTKRSDCIAPRPTQPIASKTTRQIRSNSSSSSNHSTTAPRPTQPIASKTTRQISSSSSGSTHSMTAPRPTQPIASKTTRQISSSSSSTHSTTAVSGGNAAAQQQKSKRGIGAGAIFGICILLLVVILIAAWCAYAYRHPTSKSGLFLIDATRRPRELLKRSSDGIGKTGSISLSDVKPQVL